MLAEENKLYKLKKGGIDFYTTLTPLVKMSQKWNLIHWRLRGNLIIPMVIQI